MRYNILNRHVGGGDEKDLISLRRSQVSEGLGEIVKLLGGVGSTDAMAGKEGIINGIGTGQRLGVGFGRNFTFGRAA